MEERVNNLLAPASLEEAFNSFYMLQMITPGTRAEELCRSTALPGSLCEEEHPLEVTLQERASKGCSVLIISVKNRRGSL